MRIRWMMRFLLAVLTTVSSVGLVSSASAHPPYNDVASEASITFIQVTGEQDATFHSAEEKYAPSAHGLWVPGNWAGFCRQQGRNITFQLQAERNVAAVSLSFESDKSTGIEWPVYMHVLTSADGHSWTELGGGKWSQTTDGNIETLTVSSDLGQPANYVKIIFPVKVWVFAGDLHIFAVPNAYAATGSSGQTTGSGETTGTQSGSTQNTTPAGMLQPMYANTVHHMLLVYTGANGELGSWSTNDFVPMLNYVTQTGAAPSNMFDTIAFLPYNDAGDTASGWSSYLDGLFGANGEIAALNQAVEQANQARSEARVENVVLSIPYPAPSQRRFGSIPGTSTSLDFRASDPKVGESASLTNREAAIDWYYQQLISRFEQGDYTNLVLRGVYWDEESFNHTNDDEKLVQYLGTLAAQQGLPIWWIPFYGAAGISSWKNLGFGDVLLQSNYYQTKKAQLARIDETVNVANQDGLGVEIELGENALTTLWGQNRYAKELKEFGNDLPSGGNVVEGFYDGSKILLRASDSSDPKVRALYDETGAWLQQH